MFIAYLGVIAPKLETTLVSINRWMDRQTSVSIWSGAPWGQGGKTMRGYKDTQENFGGWWIFGVFKKILLSSKFLFKF